MARIRVLGGLTDEIADVEGLVVGPEGVVDVGVPPEVAAEDVVGRGGGGDEESKDAEDYGPRHFFPFPFPWDFLRGSDSVEKK